MIRIIAPILLFVVLFTSCGGPATDAAPFSRSHGDDELAVPAWHELLTVYRDDAGRIERVYLTHLQTGNEWCIFAEAFNSGDYDFADYVYVEAVDMFSITILTALGADVPFNGEINFNGAYVWNGAYGTVPIISVADNVTLSNFQIGDSHAHGTALVGSATGRVVFDNVAVSRRHFTGSIFVGYAPEVELRNICVAYVLIVGYEYTGGLVDTAGLLTVYNLRMDSVAVYTGFWGTFRTAAALFGLFVDEARVENVLVTNTTVLGYAQASLGFSSVNVLHAANVTFENCIASAPSSTHGPETVNAVTFTESAVEVFAEDVNYINVITSAGH